MAIDGSKVIELLKSNLSSESRFALPSDGNKDVGNGRWTTYKHPKFSAAVKPANVAELQKTIKCCAENGIPFMATATGHHYANFEKAKDVLEIDISFLKSIAVNKDDNTITIGGAVKFGEVTNPLYEVEKEMPVGGCTTAGIVGVTLGGGVSPWQGLYGMMIDNLLDVEMITATGDQVKASAKENQELFWGMRGAGFNFGIVTSATYRIYDRRNGGQVFLTDLILPFTAGDSIMQILKGWEEDQPAGLSVAAVCAYNEQAGGPCFVVSAFYMDGEEEGRKLVQPFLDLGPLMQDVRSVPWNETITKWGFGAEAALQSYEEPRILYTAHIKQFDIPTFRWHFDELVKLWEKYPAARGTMIIIEDWATKARQQVPDDETAYPHRDGTCQMILLGQSTDPKLEPMLEDFLIEVRGRYDATNGFGEPRMYVSYAHGDESQDVVYGKRKLDRLRALKKKWDPKGAFSFNVPIAV